jgi:hypothetical protein
VQEVDRVEKATAVLRLAVTMGYTNRFDPSSIHGSKDYEQLVSLIGIIRGSTDFERTTARTVEFISIRF